jgi:MarR family transcriptional regulator, transcriptional regulator for hemolysin
MEHKKPPIGLVVAQAAKQITRSFEQILLESGGSLSTWLVLLALSSDGAKLQSDLARDVGVLGPTLTHHLNGMEKSGLIVRKRLAEDRRSHTVVMTAKGRSCFSRLKTSALVYDSKLNSALNGEEMLVLRHLLQRLSEASCT